jgi:multidrug resistance efflux pump
MKVQRLQKLEALIQDAVRNLKKLREENEKLRRRALQCEEENGRLKMDFRRLEFLGLKHKRIRAKLQHVAHKLDRALKLT